MGTAAVFDVGIQASYWCKTQWKGLHPANPRSNASLHKMALPAVHADIVSVISQWGVWTGREAAMPVCLQMEAVMSHLWNPEEDWKPAGGT